MPNLANQLPDDIEKLLLLKQELEHRQKLQNAELAETLPHIHGWKWYKWAREFFESRNPMTILCAANQISKSSTQIRLTIDWATDKEKWPSLWSTTPKQFWYLYPSRDVATVEFQEKWVPEFMPKVGQFINLRGKEECIHPVYGWKAVYDSKKITAIQFTSGVTVYFKAYSQDVHKLQSGSVYLLACFTAGHLVLSRKGLLPVEKVKSGDMLWTRNGWNPVTTVLCQKKSVSDRVKGFKATDDHPFWTQRGWVEYRDLTEDDFCGTVPSWKILEKLYSLRERYSAAFLSRPIRGVEIIFARLAASISMWQFGRAITKEESLKGTSFTTRILILLITVFEILSCLLGVSIQEFTRSKSGSRQRKRRLPAIIAKKILRLGLVRRLRIDTVLRSVAKRFTSKIEFVHIVRKSITSEKTHQGRRVQLNAQPKREDSYVYSINVANTHEYVTNGYYTHNCDEELPEELYSELRARTAAVGGYFRMVFTATKNQLMWYLAIEARGTNLEKFPRAHKMQVTKYDCIEYEDGTPGAYTKEKIELEVEDCKNQQEVDRRIYGRFVQEQGRKYPQFDPTRHMVEPFDIPSGWSFYGGVDPGSGGVSNHPSGMGIIAVNPQRTKGYVVDGRRMDGLETAAGDTLDAFLELKSKWPPLTVQVYDQADKDFDILATRLGEPFTKAEKNHEFGESIINTLFKNDMLFIFDTPELQKLARELMMLMSDTNKRKAQDDFIDGAVRYPGMAIPWSFEKVTRKKTEFKPKEARWTPERIEAEQIRLRRGEYQKVSEVDYGDRDIGFEEEVAEWNEAYGA